MKFELVMVLGQQTYGHLSLSSDGIPRVWNNLKILIVESWFKSMVFILGML